MKITKIVYPNKCYSMHLSTTTDGNVETVDVSIRDCNDKPTSTRSMVKESNFNTWEQAIKAYEPFYKSLDLQVPTMDDFVPSQIKMSDLIYIERKKSGTHIIGFHKYGSTEKFSSSDTLEGAIKKATQLIELQANE